MIIELFGLPGSGKTYAINKIKGNNLLNVTSENRIMNIILSFLKQVSLYMPSSLRLKRKLVCTFNKILTYPIYINNPKSFYIDNLTVVAFGYKHSGNKDIYMDEGIIHRIVSFSVNYNVDLEVFDEIVKIFTPYLSNVKIVYLDVDIDECIDSIKKRNRHDCKMDEMSKDLLDEYLKKYRFYFDYIMSKYNFISRITREDYRKVQESL